MALPPVTILPLALIAALCVTASAKTWTVARLTVALTGVGVAAHAALWAGHGVPGADGSSPELAHHAALSSGVSDAASAHALGLSPDMVLAHIAAVALSVALLRHGETLLLWLATLAERLAMPEGRLVTPPDVRGFAASRQTPALSTLIGTYGGQRAPPQLVSV
jgi:hypothetical protein